MHITEATVLSLCIYFPVGLSRFPLCCGARTPWRSPSTHLAQVLPPSSSMEELGAVTWVLWTATSSNLHFQLICSRSSEPENWARYWTSVPPEYFTLRFSANGRWGNAYQKEQQKVDLYFIIILRHSESRSSIQAPVFLKWILWRSTQVKESSRTRVTYINLMWFLWAPLFVTQQVPFLPGDPQDWA